MHDCIRNIALGKVPRVRMQTSFRRRRSSCALRSASRCFSFSMLSTYATCCFLSSSTLQAHRRGVTTYYLFITRFSCQEAKCVLQTSCNHRLPQSYPLMDLPDLSKTQGSLHSTQYAKHPGNLVKDAEHAEGVMLPTSASAELSPLPSA